MPGEDTIVIGSDEQVMQEVVTYLRMLQNIQDYIKEHPQICDVLNLVR